MKKAETKLQPTIFYTVEPSLPESLQSALYWYSSLKDEKFRSIHYVKHIDCVSILLKMTCFNLWRFSSSHNGGFSQFLQSSPENTVRSKNTHLTLQQNYDLSIFRVPLRFHFLSPIICFVLKAKFNIGETTFITLHHTYSYLFSS